MVYVGIDGGGSKTRFACYDGAGRLLGAATLESAHYRQEDLAATANTLAEGIGAVSNGLDAREIGACVGLSGYGEDAVADAEAVQELGRRLAPVSLRFYNDATVGWAGALALQSGIVINGGTGSIAYGRDPHGHEARCGGWSEYFSDEGSGYWLGKKTLELFAKQSDARAPKGALHGIVRRHFALQDDYALVGIVKRVYAGSRDKTASLQMLLLEAAEQGDVSARECYGEAAKELALIVCGAARQLDFGGAKIDVSYMGGLFHLRSLILEPMTRALEKCIDANVFAPKLSPCAGAALFAVQAFAPELLGRFKSGLLHL